MHIWQKLTREALDTAMSLLHDYDETKVALVHENETIVDQVAKTGWALHPVQVAKNEMQTKDSHTLSVLLHSIGDIERISGSRGNHCKCGKGDLR